MLSLPGEPLDRAEQAAFPEDAEHASASQQPSVAQKSSSAKEATGATEDPCCAKDTFATEQTSLSQRSSSNPRGDVTHGDVTTSSRPASGGISGPPSISTFTTPSTQQATTSITASTKETASQPPQQPSTTAAQQTTSDTTKQTATAATTKETSSEATQQVSTSICAGTSTSKRHLSENTLEGIALPEGACKSWKHRPPSAPEAELPPPPTTAAFERAPVGSCQPLPTPLLAVLLEHGLSRGSCSPLPSLPVPVPNHCQFFPVCDATEPGLWDPGRVAPHQDPCKAAQGNLSPATPGKTANSVAQPQGMGTDKSET